MKKLPYGESNYESIIMNNYYYVDKTKYIEKLENIEERKIMYLRPRKFGKTLFTSTLEYYYDVNAKDKFETLFGETYIGKYPTDLRNSYYILRFNFSGIDTRTVEDTIKGFKREIASSVELFIKRYGLKIEVDEHEDAENILDMLFKEFFLKKPQEKIYVIIDEYDHFANELLGFQTETFKELVSRNGKIRKWYEILKKGTESVVDRIFITGVSPITLDSTTSGFNIATNLTKNREFNDMLGFCEEDVIEIMREMDIPEEKQKELMPIIKENYDGYVFSDELEDNEMKKYRIYNANMTLYFVKEYLRLGKVPQKLNDTNIISDYSKIEGLMNLCKEQGKIDILEKIVEGETVVAELTEKFNSEIRFGVDELVSLLYYLGYLTIKKNELGILCFAVPNEVIRQEYTKYFLEYIKRETNITERIDTMQMATEIVYNGEITTAIETLKKYLKNLSNRDYQRFGEKYVKVIFYAICKTLNAVKVKSEYEVEGKYIDIFLTPKEEKEKYHSIMIEFKYIKKEDYDKNNNLLQEMKKEAKEQIEVYRNTEEMKAIPHLNCYTVVVVKDELYVEKVE